MATQYKRITIISYSLFLIVISSLMTVLCYHLFVFNTFSNDNSETKAFREVSYEQVAASPIKEDNSIVEVISYGCHYCAVNENNLVEFSRFLPPGSTFNVIHIANEKNSLADYASIFATLHEMGIEEAYRDSVYNAILTKSINLTDEKALESWLIRNNIDIEKYKNMRQSDAVKNYLSYMASVTQHYDINATPMFIINKRYIVAQDRDFPAFAQRMLQLLKEDK